ncbi:MAG: nucleotidyltransferase [Peltula sp. TS41687]|nr:MAG: nucleotidyltransferase [Peltula sp. TS41687]
MAPCTQCDVSRAVIMRPKNQTKLCKACFLRAFEAEIHSTIVTHRLFTRGERIAIGASGGKDSTVLASVLTTLNARHGYGLSLVLLSIDEGIRGYRDDSLQTVKRNAAQYGLPLEIVGYEELYGWTMDQVVEQVGKKGNCTYCGVFRRQALDRGAERLGIRHVVTGHNADDVAETVVMNLLRGDLPRLARATSIVTESKGSPNKRSKPLMYAYEKEIVLYAHHKKLDYFSTECIYSPEAFRGSARSLIKNMERIRPSAVLDVVRSGEDMAKLVPGELAGSGVCQGQRQRGGVVAEEEGGMGGCGSANGRSSGGEMAAMEEKLREDELGAEREMEVTSASIQRATPNGVLAENEEVNERSTSRSSSHGQRHDRGNKRIQNGKARKGSEKVSRQLKRPQMGQCARCGYLSSQEICKACMLLEGLNKNRPKMQIAVDLDDEDASSSLRRRMESVALADQ